MTPHYGERRFVSLALTHMRFPHFLDPWSNHLLKHLVRHDPLRPLRPPKARQRLLLRGSRIRVCFVDIPYRSAYDFPVIFVINNLDPVACGIVNVGFILAGFACLDGFFAGGGVGAEDGTKEGEDGVVGRGVGKPFAVNDRRKLG